VKEIPFLSIKDINTIDDYERFFYSKAYLRYLSEHLVFFKDQVKYVKKQAVKSGYSKENFNKFVEHRRKWHSFEKKIPIKYLNTIGADLDLLKLIVEFDKKDYYKVLEMPLSPKTFILNMRPIPIVKTFPKDTSQEEAIEILKYYANKEDKLCLFNIPVIKTIGVTPEGKILKKYYEPEMIFTKKYVILNETGEDIGKVFLK